jgi:uncharacterized membrane protein (UPF0136 family)
VAVGGTAGFLRTRSTPSLVAGLGLGISYGFAGSSNPWLATVNHKCRKKTLSVLKLIGILGYLIKENRDYGTELALGNSVLLLGSAVPRIVKTGGRAPIPLALGATGVLATWYYQKKVREFRYGV